MIKINNILSLEPFKHQHILSIRPIEKQGHANTIYLIRTQEKKYILREFKIKIDRKMEFKIQKKVHKQQIGAEALLLKKTLMISEFIEGTHKEKLTQRELKKMAQLLKKLHKVKIRQKRNSFKENFNTHHKKAKKAFILLNQQKKEYALGHNDLHPQNIIFNKKNIKLIDWEYARYSDIYFDLVSIIIEYKLNLKDREIFLYSYFNRKKINYKKIEAFKIIYKELWKLWFQKLERGEL
jgi:thiamine kinase-like enzyme